MKTNALLRIGAHGLLLIFAVRYGSLAYKFQLPPYSLLKAGFTILQTEEDPTTQEQFNETAKEYTETDVETHISIRQPADILERGDALLRFLWGKSELPTQLPSAVELDFHDTHLEEIPSLQRIDKIVI